MMIALTRRCATRCRAASLAVLLVFFVAATDVHATQWFVQSGGSQVAFAPQFLTIQAGDTVTFFNKGGYHNVVADDGSFRCAHGCDGDGNGGNGNASDSIWFATVSFPTAGTVGYFCEPHGAPGGGMYGTIQVLAPPPVVPAPSGNMALDLLLAVTIVAIALSWLRRLAGAGVIANTRRGNTD